MRTGRNALAPIGENPCFHSPGPRQECRDGYNRGALLVAIPLTDSDVHVGLFEVLQPGSEELVPATPSAIFRWCKSSQFRLASLCAIVCLGVVVNPASLVRASG